MNRGSLRLRLLVAGVVSVLAALGFSALGLTVLFERHVERRVVTELGIYLDQIVAGLDRGADGALAVAMPPADPRFAQPLSGLYWQIQAGDAVLRSRSLWDAELILPGDALADGAVHQHRIPGPGAAELIALERSVTLPARLGGGTMRAVVALDYADIAAASRAFAAELLPNLAVIALFLIAAAYAQVVIGLKPLAAVRNRLAAIREGRARRLGRAVPNEILPLAAEVDALLEGREVQAERARARAGDLAHGLKTPLQVLVGDVERLRGKGEAAIATEIEQVATTMRRHVDRELARARIAAGAADARARVADVVKRVLAVVVRTPAGAKLEWSVDIPTETVARIDPDDLAEAIGNLAENAARHARAKVSIRTRREAELVFVTVADDGPGIPEDRLEEALVRGGRLDRLGSGAGLGLAIVRDIADAWGGKFEIRTTANGLEADFGVRGSSSR
ncbi:MAG: HAMP domain-containing histidine kinase [Rhodospirillales bacterium]|nr:HAMP domain-containing histidine kinase [Rhodospirillales bacterium]